MNARRYKVAFDKPTKSVQNAGVYDGGPEGVRPKAE
jgi:hypothetical protein